VELCGVLAGFSSAITVCGKCDDSGSSLSESTKILSDRSESAKQSAKTF
jgi:hypothetical protein